MPKSLNSYVLCLVFAGNVLAQSSPVTPLTLTEAVEKSLRAYPSIRVSQEQLNAAAAGIQLARTAYLPRIDAIAQINRATRNNIFGLLLPQGVIPSISGPVIGSNNLGSVWGSAAGVTVTWEPFDFGLRQAGVAAAAATRAQSQATEKRTEFDVAVATADVYLTLVAAEETAKAAQAGVDRAGVIVRTISGQVNAQLRPGADQSRAEAEQAAAQTQLIQAQQTVAIDRATLSQFVGLPPPQLGVSSATLVQMPPEQEPAALNPPTNPALLEQAATIQQARTQLQILERSYFPKFALQGSAYARGTGAEINGTRLNGASGLAPNVQNYALGFTVTFPIMDLPALQAREAAQNATIRAQSAKYDQLATDLRAQWNRAVATLDGARRIARNTPIQVSAARTTTHQATARYQAGLGNIDEVAEAQRLLTQAEIDDVLARLSVWRGLLGIATVAGDIQPFIAEASR